MNIFYRAIIVCLALFVVACSAKGTPWSTLAQTRKAIAQHPDPNAPSYGKLNKKAAQQAKATLCVDDGRRCHEAASVYFCGRLTKQGDEPALRCVSTSADDTIHTTEFPPFPSIAQTSSALTLNPSPEGGWLKHAFLGDPGNMHKVGYRDVKVLSVDKQGQLTLPKIQKMALLCVIVALPNSELVKYVWVIKPGG